MFSRRPAITVAGAVIANQPLGIYDVKDSSCPPTVRLLDDIISHCVSSCVAALQTVNRPAAIKLYNKALIAVRMSAPVPVRWGFLSTANIAHKNCVSIQETDNGVVAVRDPCLTRC